MSGLNGKQLGIVVALGAGALLSACVSNPAAKEPEPAQLLTARAVLAGPTGTPMGDAVAEQTTHGIRVTVSGMALPQGPHGTHIHMVGRCEGPGFTTAGAHWNPGNAQHGRDNPQGAHAGDLPNLLIGTDGRGSLTIDVHGARMTGPGGLLDEDGAALVVHADVDDYKTDPTGNSGGRIACGVFTAG